MPSHTHAVDTLETELTAVHEVFAGLTGDDWSRSTELEPLDPTLPHWTVFELAGHFDISIGLTRMLMADPTDGQPGRDRTSFFIFPRAERRSFWMGNCLIDIDVIFLDSQGRVTATHRMKAQPPRGANESESVYRRRMPDYPSRYAAQFVIELKSGWLDRLDLKVEDRIELDLKRLKARAK